MQDALPLPFTDGPAVLPLTLAAAEALERACLHAADKGLCAAAQALVEDALDEKTVATLLGACLRLAGAQGEPAVKGDAAREALAEIFLAVLTPLRAAGAITRDEDGKKSADFKALREFFLGVMGWTPETLRAAPLRDIACAKEGFMRNRFPDHQPGRVTRRFMTQMMKKFPDTHNGEQP